MARDRIQPCTTAAGRFLHLRYGASHQRTVCGYKAASRPNEGDGRPMCPKCEKTVADA